MNIARLDQRPMRQRWHVVIMNNPRRGTWSAHCHITQPGLWTTEPHPSWKRSRQLETVDGRLTERWHCNMVDQVGDAIARPRWQLGRWWTGTVKEFGDRGATWHAVRTNRRALKQRPAEFIQHLGLWHLESRERRKCGQMSIWKPRLRRWTVSRLKGNAERRLWHESFRWRKAAAHGLTTGRHWRRHDVHQVKSGRCWMCCIRRCLIHVGRQQDIPIVKLLAKPTRVKPTIVHTPGISSGSWRAVTMRLCKVGHRRWIGYRGKWKCMTDMRVKGSGTGVELCRFGSDTEFLTTMNIHLMFLATVYFHLGCTSTVGVGHDTGIQLLRPINMHLQHAHLCWTLATSTTSLTTSSQSHS